MSENSTPEERTEMPTDKRMGELRREGQLHLSTDLVSVLTLISGFYALNFSWQYLFNDFKTVLTQSFAMIENARQLDANILYISMVSLIVLIGPHLLIIIGIVSGTAILATMLQTDWNVREKKIRFRFDMMNPITGLKRIISIQGVVTTGKAILKLCMILPIGYFALKQYAPDMVKLIHTSIETVLTYTGKSIYAIFWKIAYLLIALAVFDYFWGRYQWLKGVKMTKEEVKDEKKATEGDEVTKRKIINKGLQRIMQRIANTVPKANVIITNPTHYSVALQYDRNKMAAPIVVAKGKGFMALRIREIAKQSGIPILERKPLARALFASCEVGAEIPSELFRAVAEVLAYVYKLKNPYGNKNAGSKKDKSAGVTR